MSTPSTYKFTKSHEWVNFLSDNEATIGLTDFAQNSLGDLVFINLPQEGDEVAVKESCADIESVKAVSDIYSPVTGVVSEVNEEVLDAPQKVNEDPYGSWLVKITDISDKVELMSAEEYDNFCKEEE
ncbi:glycine cleavage system protein GcvH [Anaeropeptidivorans aminofermentans]|jgi:glycine cleavage system H protein|uniref:glycine cleavage system protein GcvH n=1 Tax=Anaeropeptidivorans aminofermentans TaxID=2934315 RepID=UPI00202462FA|nr:glycine cleavage system protein GcvH [Anaeropeptidivorans aminofermentans]MBE6011900.1 glycine cleavage system protein GcvH [Lachnospiraceae bacterium]